MITYLRNNMGIPATSGVIPSGMPSFNNQKGYDFEPEKAKALVAEYSKETAQEDVPYYPKRLEADKQLLGQYRAMAEQETGVSFLGRLATYRYMDMHHVIGEALDFSRNMLAAVAQHVSPPVFPNQEETSLS
jgi:hypothetical protein